VIYGDTGLRIVAAELGFVECLEWLQDTENGTIATERMTFKAQVTAVFTFARRAENDELEPATRILRESDRVPNPSCSAAAACSWCTSVAIRDRTLPSA